MKKFKTGRIISVALIFAMLVLILIVSAMALDLSDSKEPELNIIATNLSFSDSIYIKYAVTCNNIDQTDDVRLLIWTEPDENYAYGTQNEVISPLGITEIDGEECIVFDFKGLSAKKMTDYVYARAYYVSDGREYYSDVKKYSILTYVYNKLGYTGAATENEKFASLLRGMLEYGASAQIYFDYKTEALATDAHVKITLENGRFSDGSNAVLAIPGTEFTVTAINTDKTKSFHYWIDGNGKVVSYDETFVISAGATNQTLSAVYVSNQGGEIEGAGANLSADSFAATEHLIDTSNAIDKTSSQLSLILSPALGKNAVYRVSDNQPLKITSSFKGNGSVIIAPNGVIIEAQSSITIENVIIIGSVTLKNSDNITLTSCEIQNTTDALIIDDKCSNILIDDCRLISDANALLNYAFNTSVKSSYILADTAVINDADDFTVYNCRINADSFGIISTGNDTALNNNTVVSGGSSNAIAINGSSINTLVTYNKMKGSSDSIKITDSTNTVVLFNSCYNIIAEDNTNTYIVENSLGGHLRLTNNNYLLCDENKYTANDNNTPTMSGNTNINGNNLMDVTARNEVGAKEELLPHTNKELFLDMERKNTVKDIVGRTSYDLTAFIEENAKTNEIVIVPPGAYSTAKGDYITLNKSMSNTKIYAFGVFNEHAFVADAEYLETKKTNYILRTEGCENLTIHGITLGYDYQSSGQVHVLQKLGNQQILVIPAAGYDLEAGFGQSNPGVFSKSYTGKFDAGNPYSGLGGAGYTFVSANEDGTLILKLSTAASYDAMDVGDIMTCRMAGDNQHTVGISNSTNVKLKDVTLYGYSAALMTVVSGSTTGTSLERVHNSGRAPFVIDKETYDMYASLEQKYGVDLEIYIDDLGRYRGALPRVGSVDATHVSGSSEGLDITSCLFENMCDDGSNQRGSSSRLAGIKDNGDGTTTLYIKGMVTSTYHSLYKAAGATTKSMNPNSFSVGDRIYVYASSGELLCDTVVLTGSKSEDDMALIYDFDTIRYIIYTSSVTVPTKDVNFSAIDGYDLSDNHYSMTNKVLVDNISHCSEGFVIDNLMVRNSTARGVLIKTINATVKNSTFRNVTSTGNLLSVETSWGESTVARNIVISGCLFDNTGFDNGDPIRAPIAISGLATYGNATVDTLRASNILIKGCVFNEYGHNFGIYVNGAQNVRIIDNVFDPEDAADPGQFIKILTALNIEISGNKYRATDGTLTTISNLDVDDYTYIHGSDVGDTYKSKCDIYVGDNHLSSMRIFYTNSADSQIAENMAKKLAEICGYAVSYSDFYNEDCIKLQVLDRNSDLISSNTYTVTSDGKNLIIAAATPAALAYAVEDFTQYIEQRSASENSINFPNGYSATRTFTVKTITASDSSLFKYSGLWSASESTMTSMSDADYVEFDITGSSFTLLFSSESTFELYIDGVKQGLYTVSTEMTFSTDSGKHTVKVLCTDTSEKLCFAGIKYSFADISRTADKEHYVQFIGDSMLDSRSSFAHTIANTLGWDYSVVIGEVLPVGATEGRTPDIVFIFLGTDAINSSASANDASVFANKYKALVSDVVSKYGANTQIHLMHAISTSDAASMFDTNHVRYQAINLAMNYSIGLGNNIHAISASTVQGWNIEFDASKDATNPTMDGYDTLVSKITLYLAQKSGYTDYYNHSFNLSEMKNYNGSMQTGLSENGISFSRYNFIDKNGKPINGHVFISGNDYANRIVTDSGRYLIFKFRSSADYGISFNLRTNDYGTNLAESGRGYVYTVSRTASSLSTDWEVAVIDLSQFLRYTTNTHIGVQVRITTTASEIDIADVTIVDTMTDANLYILSELGDTEYMFYERWDEKGVRTSVTGRELTDDVEEVIDLSYVNHNFNFLNMKMYDGSKITSPTEMMKVDADGTVYNHFEFAKTGHIFFKGSNILSEINGDTGNYLVLKYRASNSTAVTNATAYLALEMQTSDLPYNSSRPYDTMKRKLQYAPNIPDSWEVAVIDLSQFSSFQRDAELNVLIRFTTQCEYVDIAYAALVDDINEAAKFVGDMGDNGYVQYTDFSMQGTSVTLK